MWILLLAIILSPVVIHFWLIKRTKEWVTKGKYFASVPEKEVVCVSKSGGPVSLYLASLKGEGLQVDRTTGQVCNGEAEKGFWNKYYGVEFIGFGGQVVKIPQAIVDASGKVTTNLLSSMRFVDDITVQIKEAETKDGVFPIDLTLEVTVRLFNVSTVLRYKEGYQKKIDTLIKAAVNEYAKDKTPEQMMGLKNEKPDGATHSDFMQLIMSLNSGDVGNISLMKLVGVDIIAVSITQVDPSENELRNLMEAKKKAEMEGEAAKSKATKEAERALIAAEGEGRAAIAKAKKKAEEAAIVAEGEAKALKIVNAAKTSSMKEKLDALGGNSEALVGLETAEAIKDFNAKGGGTLAINAPVAIGLSSKK
jgi:regulator of protease activity HflC (stomatin/prohibitin superfamily)